MAPRIFHKLIRKAGCVFLGAVLLLFSFFPPVQAETDLTAYITGAFQGRALHAAEGNDLLSDADFLRLNAGTGTGDWAAFAMARYSTVDAAGETVYYYGGGYDAYLAALEEKLAAFYAATGVTSGAKLTEYFRMGLALTALGGDCREIIAAATLNNPTPLKRQSIITLDFALLSLNALALPVPENAAHTPREYVERILSLQMADGGWSLTPVPGAQADEDVTAMTLTALGPCYRAGDKTVTAAVEKALSMLSARQSNNGDFATYGLANCESTAQVLTALTSLGIDPYKDTRFIKKGKTVVDGLLRYRLADGSFTHAYTRDPENDAAEAGGYNYLATDQAAYALVSLWRQQQGQNALYDLTPDLKPSFSAFLSRIISAVRAFFTRLAAVFQPLSQTR